MAGKRLPIELVQARGNKHLTRAEISERREQEPKSPEKIQRLLPPSWLPEDCRKEFNRLQGQLVPLLQSLLIRYDGETIAAFCVARAAWLRYSDALRRELDAKDGQALTKSDREEIEMWSRLQDKAFKQARALASDLGLTISARCQLVIPRSTEEDQPDPVAELLKRRQEA